MTSELLIFYALAAVALGGAALVVTSRNLVHSALYLIVTFFALAGVYVLLHAEFLAVVQVLVYAGGIMVLFLFVIMLVDVPAGEGKHRARAGHLVTCGVLVVLVSGLLAWHFAVTSGIPKGTGDALFAVGGGNLETVAMTLFRHYLLPFEVVSILLLVAMVGAVVLARSKD